MPFDNNAFLKAQFQARTAQLTLPVLQPFFGDENPVWIVRGQTASEVARGMESTIRRKNIDSVIQAIGNNQAKIDEIKQAIGISDDVPDDIVKRLEQLHICSVNPEIDLPVAVKLAETFPMEFYQLTNKIVELTGLGMDLKK